MKEVKEYFWFSSCESGYMELTEKHEEILGRRAELLEQMESRREQLRALKRQQTEQSEASRRRNNILLQDLQKIEDRLRGNEGLRPDLEALKTRYWASVEEHLPVWEHFLLGKGPHPTDVSSQPSARSKQKPSTAKDRGLPPRLKPRTAPKVS